MSRKSDLDNHYVHFIELEYFMIKAIPLSEIVIVLMTFASIAVCAIVISVVIQILQAIMII